MCPHAPLLSRLHWWPWQTSITFSQFSHPGIFFSLHRNFAETFDAIDCSLFFVFFPPCIPEAAILVSFFYQLLLLSFLSQTLTLLSPKTPCCSEPVLGLFTFLQDHRLLVLCLTLTLTDTLTTPQSLLWFLYHVFKLDTELLYLLNCTLSTAGFISSWD